MTQPLQDKNGIYFDAELHEVTKNGSPLKQFGRFVSKKTNTPNITVGNVLINPETKEDVIMNAEVEDKLSYEQKKEVYRKEAEEEVLKEKAKEEARNAIAILERKARELNKYKLNYNLEEFKEWATRTANEAGCKFQIDTNQNGIAGTFHIWGRGKVECGNLCQDIVVLQRTVSNFCGLQASINMDRQSGVNVFGEQTSYPVINLANITPPKPVTNVFTEFDIT